MIRRLHNKHLPRELRNKIGEILNKKVPTSGISKTVDNKRKRCALCPRNKDRKHTIQMHYMSKTILYGLSSQFMLRM